jgi:hypothetical protein
MDSYTITRRERVVALSMGLALPIPMLLADGRKKPLPGRSRQGLRGASENKNGPYLPHQRWGDMGHKVA